MTDLEFINKEILYYDDMYERKLVALDLIKEDSIGGKRIREEISFCKKRLNHLNQIKSKLEAWRVINEEFIIKPYYQVNGKHPAIMIRHRIEDDEFCRRGVRQEKYNIVKKALEAKDE